MCAARLGSAATLGVRLSLALRSGQSIDRCVAFVRKLTRRGSAGERAGDRGLQMTSTTESGDAATTAPLTFGQMSVWRDIAGLPRARWQEANIFHSFDFPKPVSRRQLCQVLTELDAKHESLRTVYDIDDPAEPRQRLLPPQPVTELEVVYAEAGDGRRVR